MRFLPFPAPFFPGGPASPSWVVGLVRDPLPAFFGRVSLVVFLLFFFWAQFGPCPSWSPIPFGALLNFCFRFGVAPIPFWALRVLLNFFRFGLFSRVFSASLHPLVGLWVLSVFSSFRAFFLGRFFFFRVWGFFHPFWVDPPFFGVLFFPFFGCVFLQFFGGFFISSLLERVCSLT